MKLTSPLRSLKAWGSIPAETCSRLYGVEGSGVFRRERNYTQLCKHYSPTNPRTSFQQSGRSVFKMAVSGWQGLPVESRQGWAHYQNYHRHKPIMSGYNFYISRFLLKGSDPGPPPV